MREIRYIEPGRVETCEAREPQLRRPGGALVRPLAVATCDLDSAIVRGLTPWKGPLPLGHEGVAEVVEVGVGVTGIRPGDRVSIPYQVSCGECRRCRAGLTAHCEGHGETGPQFYGWSESARRWGGFLSDLVLVPFADHMLLPLPAGVAPETVASLSDNIVDGWRAVAKPLEAEPGAPVLVVGGSGSIGLYAVACAVALGSERVVYADRSPSRLERAERLGAEVVQLGEEWPRRLGPFPVTVDANSTEPGLFLALRSTDHGGTCTSCGFYFSPVELPLFEFQLQNVTLHTGLIQARPGMEPVLDLIRSGRLDADAVTDRVLAWDAAEDALPEVRSKLVFSRAA